LNFVLRLSLPEWARLALNSPSFLISLSSWDYRLVPPCLTVSSVMISGIQSQFYHFQGLAYSVFCEEPVSHLGETEAARHELVFSLHFCLWDIGDFSVLATSGLTPWGLLQSTQVWGFMPACLQCSVQVPVIWAEITPLIGSRRSGAWSPSPDPWDGSIGSFRAGRVSVENAHCVSCLGWPPSY
jgi:hypothetical protein